MLISSQENDKNDEWRRWCSLPFLADPEHDSYFMQYFTMDWEQSLRTSFMNFLRAIFQNLSPPSLLGISIFKTERQRSPGAAPCLQERNHAVSRGDLARSRDHFRFFALPESSIACDPDPQRNQRPRQQEQGVGDVLESDRRDVLQAELTDLLRDVPFKQYQETLSRPSFLPLSLQTTTRSRPKPTSSRASSRRTSPRTLKTRASN